MSFRCEWSPARISVKFIASPVIRSDTTVQKIQFGSTQGCTFVLFFEVRIKRLHELVARAVLQFPQRGHHTTGAGVDESRIQAFDSGCSDRPYARIARA